MSNKTVLYVTGFSSSLRAKDLAYEFERYGRLIRCDIPAMKSANQTPFAFIEFRRELDAEDAYYDMHGRSIDGRRVTVQWAKRPPSTAWRHDGFSDRPRDSRDSRDRDPPRRDDRDDRDRRRSPPPRRRSPSPRRGGDDRDARDGRDGRDERRRSVSPRRDREDRRDERDERPRSPKREDSNGLRREEREEIRDDERDRRDD